MPELPDYPDPSDHPAHRPNQTQITFGYPDSLVQGYQYWTVHLRPKQATLAALVLVCRESAHAFSDISTDAASELPSIVRDTEEVLFQLFGYDKINWLMLMMVDPHVHFHILPRYKNKQTFSRLTFTDPGWPGQPDLGHTNSCPDDVRLDLMTHLRAHWPRKGL